MIEAYIHAYHLDKNFDFPTTPESIQNSFPVNFSEETILGRPAPQITYASSGPRTQNVTIALHRQAFALENPDIKLKDNEDAVDNLIKTIIACTVPVFDDPSKALIPPSILCRFGNEACIRGVIQGEVHVTSSGPWLKSGKMAMVQISFTVLEVEPFSAEYAFQHGMLRSISTDLARSSVWNY